MLFLLAKNSKICFHQCWQQRRTDVDFDIIVSFFTNIEYHCELFLPMKLNIIVRAVNTFFTSNENDDEKESILRWPVHPSGMLFFLLTSFFYWHPFFTGILFYQQGEREWKRINLKVTSSPTGILSIEISPPIDSLLGQICPIQMGRK